MFRAVLIVLLICVNCVSAETISVSAAVSLREALTDIAKDYEKQNSDRIELQFGASGQLAAQVRQGAPVDLFISAARRQVDDLVRDKIADATTVKVVAGNALLLIVPASATQPPKAFTDLVEERFKRIAVGDPRTVPAGEYAMEVLNALKLTDPLKARLIQGANVRQVLSYVERGEVEAGIVYRTDALTSGNLVIQAATADSKLHSAIEYPAVIVSQTKVREPARRFLEFLSSESARTALTQRGFTVPAR